MTRDDINRIYIQVSDELCDGKEWCWAGVGEPLQRFAELIAAAEREACASLEIEVVVPTKDYSSMTPLDCYEAALMDQAMAFRAAIRARGKQ